MEEVKESNQEKKQSAHNSEVPAPAQKLTGNSKSKMQHKWRAGGRAGNKLRQFEGGKS